MCSDVLTTTASNSRAVLVELAEVAAAACLRVLLRGLVDRRLKDVAERHNVLRLDAAEIRRASATNADHGDMQLFVEVSAAHDRRRSNRAGGCTYHNTRKLAARRPNHRMPAGRGRRVLAHETGSRVEIFHPHFWLHRQPGPLTSPQDGSGGGFLQAGTHQKLPSKPQKSNRSMLSLVKRKGSPSKMLSSLISTEPSRPALSSLAPGLSVPSLRARAAWTVR